MNNSTNNNNDNIDDDNNTKDVQKVSAPLHFLQKW